MQTKFNQRVLGNPRIVAAIAACLVLTAGCIDTPQSSEKQSISAAIKTPATKEAKPDPTPTVTPIPEAFDPQAKCKTRAWLVSDSYSKAEKSACFYINVGQVRSESVVLATKSGAEDQIGDWVAEAGFERVGNDYDAKTNQTKDVCIVYNDSSALCLKFSKDPEAVNSNPPTLSEAVLTASDPDSQINLRKTPDTNGKYLGYGLVGDRVEVTEQGTGTDGDTWYKVHFPKSDARGWIHGKFVSVVSTEESEPPSPDYSTSTANDTSSPYSTYSASSSSGRCNSPDDTDSRGHRCGGRSASSRRRRR